MVLYQIQLRFFRFSSARTGSPYSPRVESYGRIEDYVPPLMGKTVANSRFSSVCVLFHTKISGKTPTYLPGRSAQQASRQVGKQRIQRTGRGAQGADFILRREAHHKKRTEVSLDALLRLFAVCYVFCDSFFMLLRQFCFSRISFSGEIRCALEIRLLYGTFPAQ